MKTLIERVVNATIDPSWKLTKDANLLVYIQNGLRLLPGLFGISEIDDERVVDYVVYQLYRMRSSIKGKYWKYNTLFSKYALDKYRNQFLSSDGKSGINYYINQWLDEAELSRSSLVEIITGPKESPLKRMVYMESEEPIKKRFLNTDVGLALCQQSTTGWSPLSETCGQCDNWAECGKITAKKYPELMRYRKEIYYGNKKK